VDERSGDAEIREGNGPNGRSGRITRVTAKSARSAVPPGDNAGIVNLSDAESGVRGSLAGFRRLHFNDQSDSDFPLGFGHDRG